MVAINSLSIFDSLKILKNYATNLENKEEKMDLRTWLFKNRISLRQFAKKIDYNFSYLSLVMNFKRMPSEKLAAKIEEETQGAVKGHILIKKCEKTIK